jgi:hypothetical protein
MTGEEFYALIAKANRMTEDQKAKMREAQKQSFVRGMTTPCEHGVLDFEQCAECREPKE